LTRLPAALSALLLASGTAHADPPAVSAAPVSAAAVTFSDTFDVPPAAAVDSAKWQVATGDNVDNHERPYYTPGGRGCRSPAARACGPRSGCSAPRGKCLDVTGGGTADGTAVRLYGCNGSGAQRWTVTGAHGIVNPQAGKCLDATADGSADGTRPQLWTCTGGADQKWTIG
jgi:hypothetical protein